MAKFTTNTKPFLHALTTCAKAINNNGIVPAASCYRITNETIQACNLEISISIPFPGKTKDKFDIMVAADKLRPYIASLDEQEITVEWETIDMLIKITSSTGSCEIQGEIGTDFPEIKVTNGNEIELDMADLVEGFYRTAYSTMKNNTS